MKDIVIIADFCGPLDGTFNSRFLYLADMLAQDNKVEVITSDFNHSAKHHFDHPIERHGYKITLLHEGTYHKNVCVRRFVAHYIWGKSVKRYLATRERPDAVYCAVPTLKASNTAAKYCVEQGIRFVIDIQDLWPEAFQMVFRVPILSRVAFIPFKALADGIYERADAICAVSDTYCERALRTSRKCSKATTVYLGTELAVFDSAVARNPRPEKPLNEVWLAYCGTLGASYDLICVIDALALLNDNRVRFIVMGDGPRMEEFRIYAVKKGVSVRFTGRLPYDEMCSLLCACDVAVNPIVRGSAGSIINKHADYAAAGIPVINTQESKEYCHLVDEFQMGRNCRNGDAADLAEKIKIFVDDESLRMQMGANARRCAEERFDRAITYTLLKDAILNRT